MTSDDFVEVGELRKNSRRGLMVELRLTCTLDKPLFMSIQSVDKVICGEFEYAKVYQKREEPNPR